jgi:hypothetical protein
MPGYKVWYLHGEDVERATEVEVDDGEDVDRMDQMLEDLQPKLALDHHDSRTPEVQKFDLLKASEEPLHVCWRLVLKCYELRTRQHKVLNVNVLRSIISLRI